VPGVHPGMVLIVSLKFCFGVAYLGVPSAVENNPA
jgi:hypothetical protein